LFQQLFGGGAGRAASQPSAPMKPKPETTFEQTGAGRAASQPSSTMKPKSELTRPIHVSLEELYSGKVRRFKVGRRLLSGVIEDKILEIQILPGWRSGTEVRFQNGGNEQPNGGSQDLVFTIEEQPHTAFTREGNDLVYKPGVKIPLVDALTGEGTWTVEALDGRKLQVPLPRGVIRPGYKSVINGEGMPIREDGMVKRKGNLIIKWYIIFPSHLTPSQKEAIRKALG